MYHVMLKRLSHSISGVKTVAYLLFFFFEMVCAETSATKYPSISHTLRFRVKCIMLHYARQHLLALIYRWGAEHVIDKVAHLQKRPAQKQPFLNSLCRLLRCLALTLSSSALYSLLFFIAEKSSFSTDIHRFFVFHWIKSLWLALWCGIPNINSIKQYERYQFWPIDKTRNYSSR